MTMLQFVSVFIIVMVCWNGQYVGGQGVRFTLGGTTYQNNSLVTLEDIGEGVGGLLCQTDLTACCRGGDTPAGMAFLGDWFFPNRTALPNSIIGFVGGGTSGVPIIWNFYRNRDVSVVRLNRRGGGVTGIYHCEIPVSVVPSVVYQNIYIGVYTASTGSPSVISLTFNDQSRTLTCTSTGGPATTVTWRRDGVVITLNATHQQTQRVVDPVTGTYQTLLTIDPSVNIVGTYNCTVENNRGRSSIIVVITGPLQPSNLMSTGITHNRATIHWTVPRIAYTPENYTVHFGTSRDSLTPFSQQLHSGNNFTAANLQFSVQLTELSAGTTYYYQVVAVNSVGSAASAEQSFTTTELLPASPDNVTLTTISSPLRVTWTIDPPDGLVTNYTIYVTRLERGSTVVNYTSTNTQLLQFDVPNLDPYELVEVSVSASNSAGEGPRSPGVRGRTREEPPGIVNNCPSRWTDLASAIQVNWTAPERLNGMLLRYHLQLTTYDGRRVIATESVGSSAVIGQLDSSELRDGVPYIVSIFAENSAGNGTRCNVTDFTNELSPLAPSNVMVAHVSGTTIRVSWQSLSLVEARGHIIYHVMVTPTTGSRRRRQATQGERICTLLSPCEVPADESSVIVAGLDRDTSYSVTVGAVNSEDEAGPTSMPITATIPASSTQTCINIGTVVGVVGALVVVIIIMGVVIGVLVTRNRRYKLTVQQHAVKDEPVKWSEVAGSGDTNITTKQCEAYATVNQANKGEVPVHTGQQPPETENEIPVTKSPAYMSASEQEGGRVEEAVYEPV